MVREGDDRRGDQGLTARDFHIYRRHSCQPPIRPLWRISASLLFSEGIGQSRLSLNEFVALGATNHAKLYGLYPRKGTIAVGGDADLALWDPARRVRVAAALLHDQVAYSPYEGRELTGWPVTVLSRGRVVVQDGRLQAERGTGQFVPCAPSEWARPRGVAVPELRRLRELGPALDL